MSCVKIGTTLQSQLSLNYTSCVISKSAVCLDLDFNPQFDFTCIYLSRTKYALEVQLKNCF